MQSLRANKSRRKTTRPAARRRQSSSPASNRRRQTTATSSRTAASTPTQRRTTQGKIPPRRPGAGRTVALSLARWVARIGIVGGLAYGLLVGAKEGYEYATTSPRFEVRGLLYEPSEHLPDEQLRQLMALPPGTNILSLDLDEVAQRIVAHPWVERATVTRVLPDTLEIHVTEHEAAATLLAGTFYLVDPQGRPFKVLEEGERGELPVITGLSALEPLQAPERSHERVQRAVDILCAYRQKRRPRLSEINVDDSGVATLYTAELGTQLRLGREDVDAALSRYDALRAALGDESDKLAVAHLDSVTAPDQPERVVASFFVAQEAPGFVADAEERTKEKAAQAEAAEEKRNAKRKGASKGRKKKSRLPKYE